MAVCSTGKVTVKFCESSTTKPFESLYLNCCDCLIINIPKKATGTRFCFYNGYYDCFKCVASGYGSDVESDSSDEEDEDDESRPYVRSWNHRARGIDLTFLDDNYETIGGSNSYTYLDCDECKYLVFPEQATKIQICFAGEFRYCKSCDGERRC